MSVRAAEPTRPAAGYPVAERALAFVASLVAIGEALVLSAGDGAPIQHKWLVVGLVVTTIWTAATRSLHGPRRVAVLGLLAGAALATRATVRFSVDLSWALATVDVSATIGGALAAMLTVFGLSRTIGRPAALQVGITGLMLLACVGLVLERSPGAQLGNTPTDVAKGPWPHRIFGQWYLPHARVRSFRASNPHGYYDPPSEQRYWRLNLHSTRDLAELRFLAETPSVLRVEIDRAGSGQRWGIQLNQGPLAVRGATPYELRLTGRADRAREIGVGISEWHAPWEGLGYYRTIQLDTSWTKMADRFVLLRDDASAHIQIDVGDDPASVEFDDVVLTDLTTGQRVLLDPLPFSLTHQFNDVGCRGPDVLTRSAAPSPRRVLILGDSYALGLGVREEDLFGSRLGRLLTDAVGASGSHAQPFEVITCAVPGWGARQQRQFYEYLRGRYTPEFVVVVTTWNDGRLLNDELSPSAENEAAGADAGHIASELLRLGEQVRSDGGRLCVVLFRNTPGKIWEPVIQALAQLPGVGVPVLDLWPSLSGAWEEFADDESASAPNNRAHGVAAVAAVAFLHSQGIVQ